MSNNFLSPTHADKVPLSAMQRLRLMIESAPFFFFAAVIVLYLTVLREIVGAPPPLFYLLMGLVLIVTGHTAILRLRDLISGWAVVQDDMLLRLRHVGRRGPGRSIYYGEFEHLGKLRLMPKAYFHSHPDQRYRVIYSPVSKIVWALEEV